MSLILSGTDGLSDVDGSASTPAIRGTDTNTGIFFPAADTIAFAEGGAEVARFDSSGNLGIGTSSPASLLDVRNGTGSVVTLGKTSAFAGGQSSNIKFQEGSTQLADIGWAADTNEVRINNRIAGYTSFYTSNTERMRITSSGVLLVAKTADNIATAGFQTNASGETNVTVNGSECMNINRNTNDGDLVRFRQDNNVEGSISVSGTTVSYNGGHLARWSQLPDGSKDDTILKGTVLTNLDDMCVWIKDGEQLPNEQLNKMKVSDVEGDTNVAGVFVNWTRDEDCNTDDMNIAMTGDMIIRIAQGVTVVRGDLLMSAGDGTAKPQGDDIVRSKTIAKVTSNHVTCTYEDGSYCVPCVLMAC
jgi:phage gp45-like